MTKNMSKRSKQNRHLVSLVLYKNKWVYYDLEDKNLYFSISKKPSKNQQLYIAGLTLLSLPLVRLLNDLTIFSIPIIKYSCFILCSCLSLLIGKFVVDYYDKDLDVFPALFTDLEYSEFFEIAKKNGTLAFLFMNISSISLIGSLIAYLVYAKFLGLLIYSVLLFILYICVVNNVHRRNKVIKKLIWLTNI
jgi:hypothetical protein